MRIRNIIRLAIDEITMHIKDFCLNCILVILFMVLISVLLLINLITNGLRDEVDSNFTQDTSNIGYITISDERLADDADLDGFRMAAAELDSVKQTGYWKFQFTTEEALTRFNSIQDINKSYYIDEYKSVIECIFMDTGSFDFFDIETIDGLDMTAVKRDMSDYTPILLGYRYKDSYNVGDIFPSDTDGVLPYKIEGFIKKGTTILSEDVINLDKFTFTNEVNLDYEVIKITDKLYEYGFYFTTENGASFEDAYADIFELAINMGINSETDITVMEDVLSSEEKSVRNINKYLYSIIFVVGISCFVLMICNNVIHVESEKYEYGVLMSNGLCATDICKMLFVQKLINIIVALIVTIPIYMKLAIMIYGDNMVIKQLLIKLLFNRIIWIIILIVSMIVFISVIASIKMLKSYQPAELVREK